MAVRYAKKFRKLAGQALSRDEAEMRALIARILPPGEDGTRVLRLETEAYQRDAPMVIIGAVTADAITGEEAEELLRQAKTAPSVQSRRAEEYWEETCRRWTAIAAAERARRIAATKAAENTMAPADGDAAGSSAETAECL